MRRCTGFCAWDFAWELLTKRFGLDPEKLYPSIYPNDDEAFNIWTKQIGVPESRIAEVAGSIVGRERAQVLISQLRQMSQQSGVQVWSPSVVER